MFRLSVFVLALMSAGCVSLDPTYQRPAAPVPATLLLGLEPGRPGHAGDGVLVGLGRPGLPDLDHRLRRIVRVGSRGRVARPTTAATAATARRSGGRAVGRALLLGFGFGVRLRQR